MTAKPATPLQPLPFSIGSINRTIAAADGEYVAEVASDRDGAYIVAACNAYPELVAALRYLAAQVEDAPNSELQMQQGRCMAQDLLRELGEIS